MDEKNLTLSGRNLKINAEVGISEDTIEKIVKNLKNSNALDPDIHFGATFCGYYTTHPNKNITFTDEYNKYNIEILEDEIKITTSYKK